MMNYDLVDMWRIRNPNSKKFSWRQKSPIIQRRLDYWLISDLLQDDVVKVDIVTAIKIGPQCVLVWDFSELNVDEQLYSKSNKFLLYYSDKCRVKILQNANLQTRKQLGQKDVWTSSFEEVTGAYCFSE